jgi:hypothetical protein
MIKKIMYLDPENYFQNKAKAFIKVALKGFWKLEKLSQTHLTLKLKTFKLLDEFTK